MNYWNEFKAFALKGNVVDLAAAVILGAAVNKVVNALVENILMPPLGWLIGGVDFSKLSINLPAGDQVVPITYGVFVQAVVNFIIVAWALFMIIKVLNRLHLHSDAKPPTSEEVLLLREIRDSLKK
ncbi:MAG: large-conductance mechanosensitive channel protein MscL [Bdellovibrionales bacterium]|nr:large-conductance mechanosensitive channel protein MscL [Bdellovibrionales bacterium]